MSGIYDLGNYRNKNIGEKVDEGWGETRAVPERAVSCNWQRRLLSADSGPRGDSCVASHVREKAVLSQDQALGASPHPTAHPACGYAQEPVLSSRDDWQ